MSENVDEVLPLPSFSVLFGDGFQSTMKKKRKMYCNSSNNKCDLNSLNDETTAGRWTADEHRLFLEGIMLYGKDWKRMQPVIRTRTLVQIRTHAQKVFKKVGLRKIGLGSVATAEAAAALTSVPMGYGTNHQEWDTGPSSSSGYRPNTYSSGGQEQNIDGDSVQDLHDTDNDNENDDDISLKSFYIRPDLRQNNEKSYINNDTTNNDIHNDNNINNNSNSINPIANDINDQQYHTRHPNDETNNHTRVGGSSDGGSTYIRASSSSNGGSTYVRAGSSNGGNTSIIQDEDDYLTNLNNDDDCTIPDDDDGNSSNGGNNSIIQDDEEGDEGEGEDDVTTHWYVYIYVCLIGCSLRFTPRL
jgi:SHAQKYF class myb-like DNA-binding protein